MNITNKFTSFMLDKSASRSASIIMKTQVSSMVEEQ